MPESPRVSIITPSYNQGAFLEATIRSVLEQDYPNIEYILIDGGSKDQSLEIIRKYADRLAYWVSEPDNGQAQAINKGLRKATGDLLGWLNSDDVLLPDAISRAVTELVHDPQTDVVYGRLLRIGPQGEEIPTPLLPKDRVEFSGVSVIGECVVNQPGSLWRRRIMEQVGYLDERLHYALDYDYWVRMALAGAKFQRLPFPVAKFRLSAASKTVGQATRMAQEHLKVIDHFLGLPGLAGQLGISPETLNRQVRLGRAVVSLYAFNGCLKDRDWRAAFYWLVKAHSYNPLVLVNRRWFDLFWAKLRRPERII